MIFSPPLYGRVLRGEKTQTRRLVLPSHPTHKYQAGKRVAVQKGRGVPSEAHIILTAVRREPLDRKRCELCGGPSPWKGCTACGGLGYGSRLTIHDAKAEGFRTSDAFRLYWISLHDKAWVERWERTMPKTPEGQTVEDFDAAALARFSKRWAPKEVWVLSFVLDHSEEPRFLMQGSPLTDGGKARLMSNRKLPPGRAKAREVTGPEKHGYTASPARAVPNEPEPVDPRLQDRYSREGHQGFVARERARELDREHLLAEERIHLGRIEARAQGLDIAGYEAAILQRVRAMERKIYSGKTGRKAA